MQTINQRLTELKFVTFDFGGLKIQKNPDFSFVSRLEQFNFNGYLSQDLSTTFNMFVNHNGPNLQSIKFYKSIHLIQDYLKGKHLHNSLYIYLIDTAFLFFFISHNAIGQKFGSKIQTFASEYLLRNTGENFISTVSKV